MSNIHSCYTDEQWFDLYKWYLNLCTHKIDWDTFCCYVWTKCEISKHVISKIVLNCFYVRIGEWNTITFEPDRIDIDQSTFRWVSFSVFFFFCISYIKRSDLDHFNCMMGYSFWTSLTLRQFIRIENYAKQITKPLTESTLAIALNNRNSTLNAAHSIWAQ